MTIVAWINYQANEPVEGVASVMVRDIARILTPDHVPFVYRKGFGALETLMESQRMERLG